MSLHEEHPRIAEVEERQPWIYTYGDLLTLLLCFFIIIATATQKTEVQVKSGISYGLRGGPPASPFFFDGARNLIEGPEVEKSALTNLIVGADVLVSDRGIMVSLNEQVAFSSGSSTLTNEAREILRSFSDLIVNLPNSIVIEGHTDDQPISTARFPSNWSLSSDRAANVAGELERLGVKAKRMEVVGYGSTRPKVENTDAASRAINRRIDILIRPDDGPP